MGLPAARITDLTAHGGMIVTGKLTVLIGLLPAARITDKHLCLPIHWGGPIIPPCALNVLIGGLPAARITDKLVCGCGVPDIIVTGKTNVLIGTETPTAGLSVSFLPNGDIKLGNAITITGTEEFKYRVMGDLARIAATKTGDDLLRSIDASGKQMKIERITCGNCETAKNSDGFKREDGTNGPGTDTTVKYNPWNADGTERDKIGDEPWETRPPAIGLAHEMIHGEQDMHGTTERGTSANDKQPDPANPGSYATEQDYELETAGIPPHDKNAHTENKIRSEWEPKQPERKWY